MKINNDKYAKLQETAARIRARIVKMSANNGCFIGAALSIVDIVTALYFKILNFDPKDTNNPNRDYLILSKGHAVPAIYGAFVDLGILTEDEFIKKQKIGSKFFFHPSPDVPGIEAGTGSLGHGTSIGVGIAKALKIDGEKNKVFVICGDGEMQEGSVWEAAMFASASKLDNLCFIADRNKIQANKRTEDLIPLEPLINKWKAFGWAVKEINGHDYGELINSLEKLPLEIDKPTMIIANTVRGKGISFLENRIDKWFAQITRDEETAALKELEVN